MKIRSLNNYGLAILIGLYSLVVLSIPAQAAPNSVYLDPATISVQQNDTFTVDVRADTADSDSAQINISYPTGSLDLVSYDRTGSAFASETGLVNNPGDFQISLFKNGGDPNVNGDVFLLTLTFDALVGSGNATIDVLATSRTLLAGVDVTSGTGDSVVSFTAPADTQAPTAPTSLTGIVSGNSVDLSWGASTDNDLVSFYNIYRDGLQIDFVAGGSTVNYTDSTVIQGDTYDYTVRAMDPSANLSVDSNIFSATIPYSDSQPTAPVQVDLDELAIVTGSRGIITVNCGTLKGTGTVADIVMSCGKVAPGLSPGILSSGNVTFTGGEYEVELGGTTPGNSDNNHDQLNVTGTVDLGTSTTLNVIHWNGFLAALNDQFVIINNDGTDAVTGTFQGLAQGATLTVDGIEYTISYTGGDGNDVVLTATSTSTTPTTPETGFEQVKSYAPLALLTTIIALAAVLVSRKTINRI